MQECKDGYELRKGYTRKFKNSILRNGYTVLRKGKLFKVRPEKSSAYISSMCVKKKSKKWIGKLRKGDLIRYGYQYRLSDRLREAALRKAIEVYGATMADSFFMISGLRSKGTELGRACFPNGEKRCAQGDP
jgi:hypothetical protein